MNLPPGDVNALLASLRYRLQRRIEMAGLALHWEVEALPPWPAGARDTEAMRHLQYLVFEAMSNTLQHAQASEMTLGASSDRRAIRVQLRDNGCGLDTAALAADSAALRAMRDRARLLGARLDIAACQPGLRVTVVLPLEPLA
jgi:signal transduction histidine kinase